MTMKIFSSLHLLAALGVLGVATAASAQVDTTQWKCTSCPYPKGTSGTVDAGVGYVTDSSEKFGDYTGLDKKGAFAILDGAVSRRGNDGYWADLWAADLGLDNRRLFGRAGREGLYSLDIGYAQIPRHLTEGARTPFLGAGGAVQTLPPGFPAADTTSMPLGSTLRSLDTGYDYRRFDLGGNYLAGGPWSLRLSFRHDERDGTKPTAGSFFSSAAQLVAPVHEKTDQAELAVGYATRLVQATVGYQFSSFRNDNASLTWTNPFFPVVPGATTGQLALAPDNQFHQIRGTVGYDISPTMRVTAHAAYGRMTQDDGYLPATQNAVLGPTVPALPRQSLDGKVDTFNGGVKLTATPMAGLRLTGSYDRDVRDNDTPRDAYPVVITDMLLPGTTRENTPFSWTIDRFKLLGDYTSDKLPAAMRITGGVEYDMRDRTYQEVVTTREWTLWGKLAARPGENLATWLRLEHSWRDNSTYGTSAWLDSPDNPLLRKFNLADRRRNAIEARLDYTINAKVSVGLSGELTDDDYDDTALGLVSARSGNLAADIAFAISETTNGRAWLQTQQIRSKQTGSEAFSAPDWTGRVKDTLDVLGFGIKHTAPENKYEVGADLTFSRARSDVSVDNGTGIPGFPDAKTRIDSLKLYGAYRINDKMSIAGSYAYEHYDSDDWRYDDIAPATLPNFLALGNKAPHYSLSVFRVALRYRF
jgi:MtrB/PioB family decaheme-associated outer membrane protein